MHVRCADDAADAGLQGGGRGEAVLGERGWCGDAGLADGEFAEGAAVEGAEGGGCGWWHFGLWWVGRGVLRW